MRRIGVVLSAVAMAAVLAGCGPRIAEDIFAPLGEPLPSATPEELETFARGREVALSRFTAETGLGPDFNLTFCGGCHEKPVPGGGGGRYRNFLLVAERLPDDSFVFTGINGIQDQYTLDPIGRKPDDPATNVIALRNPIPFFGVGLLAELDEESILANADPDDEDGDGISGRPNFDRGFVGRFGRKCQTVSIEGFIRGPLFNHLGVTTDPLSPELQAMLPVPSVAMETSALFGAGGIGAGAFARNLGHGVGAIDLFQAAAPSEPTIDDDGVPDPEMPEADLFDLVSFSMLLAAPMPDEPTPETEEGERLFDDVGCSGCHVPSLRGPRGLIPAYTDLLLHDMGPELADGIEMGVATGNEFRTQPLWGVVAVAPYLHDGRADTLEEAILWHGGEAEAVRLAYQALSAGDQELIIAFLESLGGADQRTDGLVPPNDPIPPAGEFGGPIATLTGDDLARFELGRAVFDRDFAVGVGLGPRFNGDACRACHFDPVIGGSGPVDVDVSRHGVWDATTMTWSPPNIGTMAHKHSVDPERPPTDPAANVFELRETPAVFGLGLVDLIPEAAILANEDPMDLDGDGISGRAHVLPDGRVGRLGWKAGVPSLQEFARDGMTNEVGITVPDEPGQTFGSGTDGDDAADPEISLAELEAMVFYMSNLAPPPRSSTDPAAEAAGEMLFSTVGCGACHIPEMPASDGSMVPAYSDFLLHDVSPPGYLGIEDGMATMVEFRTAPLWGLSVTGPYMHDGRAFSIEEAIARHDSEAAAAVVAYQALTAMERGDLLAFLASL